MKKRVYLVALLLVGCFTLFGIKVNADETNSNTNYIKESNGAVLDFSEATFYDENMNIVDKDAVMETMKPVPPKLRIGGGYSGGSWTNGSGYSVCKGMKVTKNYGGVFVISYYVDFQNIQLGYDRLDRVYGATASGIGEFSWLSNGVFRARETDQASAYGGVKGQYTATAGTTASTTLYVYFRVGNDRYWLDTNF